MPEGFGPPDYTDYNPELDAVMLALHPGKIETPSTDSWLLQESCFRLDASKFHRGILNSHGTIPIAPQASAGDQKTGKNGSQSRSSSRKRCRKRFPKRDI